MMDDMGKKIYDLRTEQGMTLEELGNKVGVGKSTVRKWENGLIGNMRRDKVIKVAKALNTTPAYLLGWDTEDDDNTLAARLLYRYRELDDLDQELARRVLKCDENFNRV